MRSRLPFTALGFSALGIVLGFVLGGIGPRLEADTQAEEIARLERQLAEVDTGGWRSPVPGLDRILRAPRDEAPAERPLPVAPPPEEGEAEVYAPDGGAAPPRRWREQWRDRASETAPSERLAAFERAASLQNVRRLQSRAALAQQGDLDDGEIAAVDEALERMNADLQAHGEALITLAMSDEPPPARDLLGITHDVTGILHRTQVRLESILGPERAAEVDPSALEIWNFVDLYRLEPAARAAMQR
ncbi:MAG: hypothetical protein VYE22_04840 [Myxococcota bacterium]|nr:hypothetical protein [Myxococcota bacterium]